VAPGTAAAGEVQNQEEHEHDNSYHAEHLDSARRGVVVV